MNADAIKVAQAYPQAMSAMAANPGAFAQLMNNPKALSVMAQHAGAISTLARSADFMALAMNPAFARSLQTGALAQAMNSGAFSTGAAAR